MTTSACTGTPISWLRLERYADKGSDLDDAERSTIADHLASCPACSACLGEITADDRELPPLPQPRRLARVVWIGGGLALAAALLLAVGRIPRTEDPMARMKGDGVAFTLVREDETIFADASGIYRDGDRWKALVTCPVGMRGSFDVVVYERGVASFPLPPAADLACGNQVPIPGAFRVTGRERLTVCLVWGETSARGNIAQTPPSSLPRASCKVLDPAP